jgi:glutamyl-tRNA reductase
VSGGGPDLFLVGLSHRTAPIAVRERVALSGEHLRAALRGLRAQPGVQEVMVISTCNRVEIYLVADSAREAHRFFSERAPQAAQHLYQEQGSGAARHLFQVAASLDSMVLGEPQILGQVKEAYDAASAVSTVGGQISRLCHRAFATAKRVRNETAIAVGAGNVSQVAVELVRKIFGGLEGRTILLIGAGKMGELSAKALAGLGARRVLVTNRSLERAQALAARVGGEAQPFSGLHQLLEDADVALVSTAADGFVITPALAEQAMLARKRRTLCFIDLAVPRNVDPECGGLENVFAYDIDDLQKLVQATRQARVGEAVRAEAIIEAELMAFGRERQTRAALPILATLRRHAEEMAKAEAERTLAQIGSQLDERGRRSVEAMAHAIVNKLLHAPTARLKDAASAEDSALPSAAAELFGLEPEEDEGRDPAEVLSLAERKKR